MGITVVADESYGNKDTDMNAQLTKIRATDAQAIINFGFGQAPAIVTKNIKQQGITLPISSAPRRRLQNLYRSGRAAAEV